MALPRNTAFKQKTEVQLMIKKLKSEQNSSLARQLKLSNLLQKMMGFMM